MELKVAIAGLGAIGKVVASRILKGISGLTVTAVATRREELALAFLKEHGSECDVQILPLKEPAAVADVIVECLPSSAFDELAEPVTTLRQIACRRQCRRFDSPPAPIRIGEDTWRPDYRPDWGPDRIRCGASSRPRQDLFGSDDHTQTSKRLGGCPLSFGT